MYCSGCGTRLQSDLNYCNRCGRRVAEDSEKSSIAESLSSSLGYVGGFGFFSFIFVVIALVKNGVVGSQLVAIAFFYLAALFAICFLILRQTELFSKGPRGSRRNAELPAEGDPQQYAAPTPTTSRLKELGQPGVGSVIDETTRTLDEVRVERR